MGRPGELAAGFGLKHETLERFLDVLKTMYLVDEVPAWQGGDYDGVGKRAKWFAGDTGMMAAGVVKSDDFAALEWFREHAAKGRKFTGVVLYAGERALRFGEGLYAVPLGALCS